MGKIWARRALLESGWAENVGVTFDETGTISSLEVGLKPAGYVTGILLPAPANAHSHAFQRALAGLTERQSPGSFDSFWTWRQLMFRFLNRLTPEHVQAISAFVQMEMLEAGYAANVEFHYLHHQPSGAPYDNLAEMSERIAAAASLTGIGLTLLPVHYQYGGCDGRPLGAGQIRFGNDLSQYARLHSAAARLMNYLPADCQLGIAPHSLRAVAQDDFKTYPSIAAHCPFHMHLAEQAAEVDEVMSAYGARPVEWVLDNLPVADHMCFIHCTQMLSHETTRLARSGAVAGLCPLTESNLGDGIFDGVSWLAENGKLAIGSDSNIRISLSEELRTLEHSQRLRDHARARLATTELSTGRRLFEAAAKGGAQAAGRNSGAIAPGKLADLLALDDRSIHLEGRSNDTILDSFIFAGDDRLITDLWAAGRHQVREGLHTQRHSITEAYRQVVRSLGDAI